APAGSQGPRSGAGRVVAGRGRTWPAVTPAGQRSRGTARLPLLIALQFLTRLPVRLPRMPTAEESGRSLLWYPWVGLLIGAVLLLGHGLLNGVSSGPQAEVLLARWVCRSGGLHLDGPADTAAGWVADYGDRERTLASMKDPTC